MKCDRHGQAAIISPSDWVKMKRHCLNPAYRIMFSIAHFTGERMGAIRQLKVRDVFDATGRPGSTITFRAKTRKGKDAKTRQVPIHADLMTLLAAYRPSADHVWLFPGRGDRPITFRAVDYYFRDLIARCGLDAKGYSTHSFRRTFITTLHRRGVDLFTIKQLTGHQDMASLLRYIETDPNRHIQALSLIEA